MADKSYTNEILIEHLADYLESTGRSSNKPFRCINPSHNDVHPSMSFDSKHNKVKCFSCGVRYDIFDVIGIDYNLIGFKEQFQKACEIYQISASSDVMTNNQRYRRSERVKEKPSNFEDFFLKANLDLDKTPYHRGISKQTLNNFNVGYVAEWRHPAVPDRVPYSPRLIIPTSAESYIARDTRTDIPTSAEKYKKQKVGNVHIFNMDIIGKTAGTVFITEGEIDALSIIDVGADAVGLGSLSMVDSFLKQLEEIRTEQTFIIALDNEDSSPVKIAASKLENGIKSKGLKCYTVHLYDKYKDANEILNADRNLLTQNINEAMAKVKAGEDLEKECYLKTSAAHFLQSFVDGVSESASTPPTATNFTGLDRLLDGGLYTGLYIIGAMSSLGKTTLTLQIADQIAQNGTDVLYFSLEMARYELMAKSISRHTMDISIEKTGNTRNAKTMRGITDGSRWKNYSSTEIDIIKTAIDEYSSYANHLFIVEGMGDVGVQKIREHVEKHITFTGNKPIVFIDYLQILEPYNERTSDKQNTDKAILELKRLSRDLNIPVFVISSFNRENYIGEVKMQAFKESGAIEYGADVLLGLQFRGEDNKDAKNIKQAKKKNPRNVELVILKNRNGETETTVPFDYYPLFNYFEEV